MKVIKRDSPKISFPTLMKMTGEETIILFTANNTGTVVYADADSVYDIGHYSDGWGAEDYFVPYDGELTLSN